MNNKKILILSILLISFFSSQATIRYVKTTAAGIGDGSTWEDCSNDLQMIINASSPSDTIYVAEGTYVPTHRGDTISNTIKPGNRNNTFLITDSLNIFGGFPNNIDNTRLRKLAFRNAKDYPTILSGDLSGDDGPGFTNMGDNAYHVVIANKITSGHLDGFTISGGNGQDNTKGYSLRNDPAQSYIFAGEGGGIINIGSSLTYSNLIIKNNRSQVGAGIAIIPGETLADWGGSGCPATPEEMNEEDPGYWDCWNFKEYSSAPIMLNCEVYENQNFNSSGGGVANIGSKLKMINCVIRDNTCIVEGGGIMCWDLSETTIINSLIYNNSSDFKGAGIALNGITSFTMINSNITKNNCTSGFSYDGSGLHYGGIGTSTIRNSIIWGNTGTDEESNVAEADFFNSYCTGVTGTTPSLNNNIDGSLDPGFVDGANHNYKLTLTSNLKDKGNNTYLNSLDLKLNKATTATYNIEVDLDNNPRVFNGIVDLGAYEYIPNVTVGAGGIIYVKKNATGTESGENWENAIKEFADALVITKEMNNTTPNTVKEIWVATASNLIEQGFYVPKYNFVDFDSNNNPTTERDMTFLLPLNVKIYGGFEGLTGTEGVFESRNPKEFATLLSADIGFEGDISDNCHHVIVAAGDNASVTLDGFTIIYGFAVTYEGKVEVVDVANKKQINLISGNLKELSDVELDGKYYIDRNSGGGLYIISSSGNFPAIFSNLVIAENIALANGGGICTAYSNPIFDRNTIYYNYGVYGGGMYNVSTNGTIKNTLIKANIADGYGGGIIFDGAHDTLLNLTISANEAIFDGGGLGFMAGTDVNVYNTIIWENLTNSGISNQYFINSSSVNFKKSLVMDEDLTPDNLDGTTALPQFYIDPYSSEITYELTVNSTDVIDKGDDALYPDLANALDLNGNKRKEKASIDLGAFEFPVNKWYGNIDHDWAIPENWTAKHLPLEGDSILFHDFPLQHLVMNTDHRVGKIYNHSSKHLDINGKKLTVESVFDFGTLAYIKGNTSPSTLILSGTESGQLIPPFTDSSVYNLTIDNPNSNLSSPDSLVVGNDLTISQGSLTIPTSNYLYVTNNISNTVGTTGLVIQSSETQPTGTLLFHNTGGNPVPATVQMYSKAFINDGGAEGGKYKWQFFGIPVASVTASNVFSGSYLREWNEAGDENAATYYWKELVNSSVLNAFTGYEITHPVAKTMNFSGNLVNQDYNLNLNFSPSGKYPGQYVLGNSYTASIDIKKIEFGNGMDSTIYIYNTGSYNDWGTNSTNPSLTEIAAPGQYMAIPQLQAGAAGILSRIPPMQGFTVKAKGDVPNRTVNIPYLAANLKNDSPLRSKSLTDNNKVYTIINVKGENFFDRMWLFTQDNTTRNFDNGWDGRKQIIANGIVPQIFAIENDGNYQVNTVPDIHNTTLGFIQGKDTQYTLEFTHSNTASVYDKMYLLDLTTNVVTDITDDGTEYTFTADSTTEQTERFKILTQYENPGGTTNDVNIYAHNGNIYALNLSGINGKVEIYDLSGRKLIQRSLNSTGVTTLSTTLPAGTYIINASTTDNDKITEKVILK